ncbi:conserved hypothetical protein (plasmid) [Candidatus Protochlamydia naegleriophila]|uniref:Uncharacterized protein n=1 Tax=Candidatus Protochlamydia naegleriophila TaxID=389348 RepID=A0A0U5EV37_9BACT|nr:hypothetical protein [Candidatus Protochlamydia naegleriophila]CUI18115.1 conserved hypothetical protein [Candidatus Protochlamydia naegleriophila]
MAKCLLKQEIRTTCHPINKPVFSALEALQQPSLSTQRPIISGPKNSISKLVEEINNWLGNDTKMIRNKAGDSVFLSKDETRRVRFDFNRPNPHNNSHMHLEEIINNKWNKSGQIYPVDVPHN